jgi:release factor glutamine methyltransferase
MRRMTVREAIRRVIGRLEESRRPEAEELVSRLLGVRRLHLHLHPGATLSVDQQRTLETWIGRRIAGEPVQYITGRAAFRGLDLAVTPDVLVPRPETEGLVDQALEVLSRERERWPAPRVIDLGTGSGAIALSVASEWPDAIVTATDVSPQALAVARRNAEELGLSDRVRFLEGEWFHAVDMAERFEAVISNPPYISEAERAMLPPDVRDHEPEISLFSGEDGLAALFGIVDAAPLYLEENGLLALELAEARADQVLSWFQDDDSWRSADLVNDLAGRPRVLVARRGAD